MYTLGLVLAGGAARGAYEAGVLRYLLLEIPRRLGHVPWPDVVSGTSVGALNGVFTVTRHLDYLHRMTRIWREMEIGDIYALHAAPVLRTVRGMFSANQTAALLDVEPLYELARREFPRAAMRQSIDSGACRAFIVAATQLDDGFNMLFCDTAQQGMDLDPLPGARMRRVQLTEQHLLASAALPFLFPPVRVDGTLYVDGGLRQNTPLRPALRAGADRILTVGAHAGRRSAAEQTAASPSGIAPHPSPSIPFLAGKTLNALMLDPVERDLHNAEHVNRIVAWGRAHYGEEFAQRLQRDLGVREVRNLFLRPSLDLGRVAAETYRSSPPRASAQVRWLLSLIADQANRAEGESDLLSYLYFDRHFTATLEQLGYEDTRAREDDILRFLTAE